MRRYFVSYTHGRGSGNAFIELDDNEIFNINKQSRIIEKMNGYAKNTLVMMNFIEMKDNEVSGFNEN